MKRIIIASIMLLAVVFSQMVYKGGDVRLSPRLLNYQGYLTDTLGNPVTNPSVSMTFSIFDAASAGNQKWSETQATVNVDKGIFSVLLGTVTPVPDSMFNNPDRWLELSVGGQTLAPRTRIVSAPYAYTATYSDTALYTKNAAADNDWLFLISDGADTTLQMGGRWGLTRPGNMMYGNADSTHVNFGVACTTGRSGQNNKYCTVGGGYRNLALDPYATVGGGVGNKALGRDATVGGGVSNTAVDTCATVGGGSGNAANGPYTTIGGGYLNYVYDDCATVGGGSRNMAYSLYATVGGGRENVANMYFATVAGGDTNTASAYASTVGGGARNTTNRNYATVGGGYGNFVPGEYSIICGGDRNIARGDYSIVSSGQLNTADGHFSIVSGGGHNLAGGYSSIIVGGMGNRVDGGFSTIIGGYADTIFEGGDYSYLFGINSNLTQDSTFMVDMPHVRFGTEANGYEFPRARGSNGQVMVTNGSGQLSWSSASADTDWVISGSNQYSGVSGNVGIGTTSPAQKLDVNGTARMTGFALPTGATNGYVLTSNASGAGTWQAVPADADWVISGSNQYSGVSGNVGIGTSTPRYKLDVNGVICGGTNCAASGSYAHVGGGYWNTASASYTTVAGGYQNYANAGSATIPGGYQDTALANESFAANYSTKVSSGHNNSAAFTTSHTTAADQVRAAAFSTGTLDFAMDHPDDPMNKILNQYGVSSDEVQSQYSGSVVLDVDGRAVVNLPDYFDRINRNSRIQLTGVGSPDVVYVAEDVRGNTFTIGGKPGMKVYWTVTAERTDIHAEIARINTPVVQEKQGDLRGHSIDDDAMISIYDGIKPRNPELFTFKTDEGRRVHEQAKKKIENNN